MVAVKDLRVPQPVNLNHEFVQSLTSSNEEHRGHSSRINNHFPTNVTLQYPPPALVLEKRGTLRHQAHSELVFRDGPYATISTHSYDHDLYASTSPDDPRSAASPVSQSHSSHSSSSAHFESLYACEQDTASSPINSHFATNVMLPSPPPTLVLEQRGTLKHRGTISSYSHDHDLHASTSPDEPWSAASPVSQSHSSQSSTAHFGLHQAILKAAIGSNVSDHSAAASPETSSPQHLGQNLSGLDQSAWGQLQGNAQTEQEIFHPADLEGFAWDRPCVCHSDCGECAEAAVLIARGTSHTALTELPEGHLPDLQRCACSAMFEATHPAVGLTKCPTQAIDSFSNEFGPSPSWGSTSPGSCTSSQWEQESSAHSTTVPYNTGPGGATNQHGSGSCGWVANPGTCQEAPDEFSFLNNLLAKLDADKLLAGPNGACMCLRLHGCMHVCWFHH